MGQLGAVEQIVATGNCAVARLSGVERDDIFEFWFSFIPLTVWTFNVEETWVVLRIRETQQNDHLVPAHWGGLWTTSRERDDYTCSECFSYVPLRTCKAAQRTRKLGNMTTSCLKIRILQVNNLPKFAHAHQCEMKLKSRLSRS